MYDSRLSTEVDVYKIGNPDMYGATALAWYDASKFSSLSAAYKADAALSSHLNELAKPNWYTTNVRHLSCI